MKKYILVVIYYYIWVLLIYSWQTSNQKPFSIKFLDVGQGDAILIETPENRVLVDTGPPESMQTYLNPFCNIDTVFITHLHLDHFGGLPELLKTCKIKSLTFNDISLKGNAYLTLQHLIVKKFKNKTFVQPIFDNNTFQYGELKIIALWPTKEFISKSKSTDDLNQMSTVLFVDFHDFEAILTGDAESQVLSYLDYAKITPYIENGLDVLKVPHHGSRKGLTPAILAILKPKYCVISVGKGNAYGHPTTYALSILKESGCTIYRTDEIGTIEFNAL